MVDSRGMDYVGGFKTAGLTWCRLQDMSDTIDTISAVFIGEAGLPFSKGWV